MVLPNQNQRVKSLIDYYSKGNVSQFVSKLDGISHQRLNRIFNLDGRSNKYPGVSSDIISAILKGYPEVSSSWLINGEGEMLAETPTKEKLSIRKPKVFDDPNSDGLIFVPIAAQAGYTRQFTDPVYLNQLERVYIPGFPYRGPRYRIFEVNGESMEPTFKEGFHLVAETVDKDSWHQIADYYIYVIVLENEILTKRLFKKSENEFVAISDNEEFFPQFIINKADVKELWLVKRKLDWVMPPPKRFKISI